MDEEGEIRPSTNELVDDFLREYKSPRTKNTDNEWLGPIGVTGHVDEVNGPNAAEVAEFVPTRHELLQLAMYWAKVAIDIEYWWFCFQQVGSNETRQRAFAWRRVARIGDLLGKEPVDTAVDEVYEEMGKTAHPTYWHAFLHGSQKEQKAVQEEILHSLDCNRGNKKRDRQTRRQK